MKNIFITIEGVDGTGKSTVTKLLAKMIGGISISTPPSSSKAERIIIEKSNNKHEKFKFYISQIIKQQQEIRNIIKNHHIVCDRYIHSTFAYNWPYSKPLPTSINNYRNDIIVPDYSFLLIADDVVRKNRIKNRENSTGKVNAADYQYSIIESAKLRFSNMSELILIDVNKKTPQEICEELKSLTLKLK